MDNIVAAFFDRFDFNAMGFLIFLVVFYIIPIIGAYEYVRCAYSKNGIYSNSDAGFDALVVTFCPILNIGLAINWFFSSPVKESPKEKSNKINRFFNVKK